MPPTRPRRIVRRAVMALAVVVLLPVWYVASLFAIGFLSGADALPAFVGPSGFLNVYTVPANWYYDRDLPGSEELDSFVRWSVEAGERAAGR